MPYRPIYLWEITVNKLFTAVGTPAHSRPTVAGPTGRQGPSGRSPAVGTYEGWVTSYGVCGHLLDSLSAWGHSVTLFKPEQAHFGRFYGIMFFRKASPQTEGRRHADPLIKTSPVTINISVKRRDYNDQRAARQTHVQGRARGNSFKAL